MSDADALAILLLARDPVDQGELYQLAAPDADVIGWLQQQCDLHPREAAALAPYLHRALQRMTPRGA